MEETCGKSPCISREEKIFEEQIPVRSFAQGFVVVLNSHCLTDSACFAVKTLVTGRAHRKSLTRQSSIQNNGFKEIVLFHWLQQKTDGVWSCGDFSNHLLAVNIIDFTAVFFYIGVDKVL